jgi:hypothetical protein
MKLVTPRRKPWKDVTQVIRIRIREEDLATMDRDAWLYDMSRSAWAAAAIQLVAGLIQEGFATDLISAQVLIHGAKAGHPFGPPNPVSPERRDRRGLRLVSNPA